MKKAWKIAGITALVAVVGLVTVTAVAFAQEPETSDGPFNFYERFRQALAGILGISVEEYDSAVEQAQGQVIDEALAEGWLTQDQADRMLERMAQGPGFGMEGMGGFMGRPGRGMGGGGVNLISVAADALGMSQDDLLAALQEGQTISDIASEQGVDPQTIADAYLAQLTENLNQAVEEGRLTQNQADWMLQQEQERLPDQLSATWEDHALGGPHGGRGPGRVPFGAPPETDEP